jgi:flagellar protein FliS
MSVGQFEVAQAYAKAAQSTVETGPMLLVGLYDRLAHELQLAKEFIQEGDTLRANGSLQHAQKIVHVLRSSLDADGFEGGQTLLALYNTLVEQLVKANLHKDVAIIQLCQDIVAPLHSAWAEAVAREMQRNAPGATVGVG